MRWVCEFCGKHFKHMPLRAPGGQACCSQGCVDLGERLGFNPAGQAKR